MTNDPLTDPLDSTDSFLAGWLDAIWSTFSSDEQFDACVPTDVRKQLIRRGWLRPLSAESEDGRRTATITPLGARVVLGLNKRAGITRIIVDEDGDEYQL